MKISNRLKAGKYPALILQPAIPYLSSLVYRVFRSISRIFAALLLFPGHMATGVECPTATGEYYQYNSVDYFYCETTSPGWLVGELPPEMQGESATVIQVQ